MLINSFRFANNPAFLNTYSTEFDGVDDYVDCGASTLSGETALSISAWVYPTVYGDATAPSFVSTDAASPRAFYLGLFNGTNFRFSLSTDGANLTSLDTAIGTVTLNAWQHILVTWDQVNLKLYKNGVLLKTVATTFASNGTLTTTNDLLIGARRSNAGFFNGNIDEVSIFNSVIPIGDLWDGSGQATDLNLLATPPVAWYRMGDNGSWKSPQWLLPSNENKDKVSNYSFEFDGVDDKVELGAQSLGITGAISVSAWVKIPTTNTGGGGTNIQNIVCEDRTSGTNRNWTLFWRGGGLNQITGVIWDSGGSAVAVTTNAIVPNDGIWHHVMFTYTGDTSTDGLKLFVDGIQRAQATSANGGTRATTAVVPTIGGLSQSITWMFEGNIDEVSVFNSDQSANIATLYNSGTPTTLPSGAVAHYKMGEEANFTSNWLVDNSALTNYSKRSFDFDGVDDYVDLGSSSTVADGGQFSLSFWIKGTSQSAGAKYLFSADYYNLNTYWTIQNTELYWRDINNVYKLLSTNLLDGEWHHILIIWNPDGANSTIRCFTDGVNEVNIATDFRYAPGWNGGAYQGGLQYIGNRGGGTFSGFNGSIDEFAVWDNDQSSNVLDIYNGGEPTTLPSGAVAHWRMGEDASFNGTNWTVPDNIGTNNGTSNAMTVDALVGEAPNYSGGGISNAMTIEDRVGEAPNSENNALSYNMESVDRTTDVPTTPPFTNTYSVLFDGVDDNVYLQNLTSRKVQTLTMSVWVKPTAFARDGIVLNGHTSYGNEGIEIYWNFNQFAVRINGTIQGLGSGNGQNNWTHIAIAYDGNTLKRMVNGVPNTDVVIGQAINYTNYNGLVLGRSPYGFHIGNIDEFAFWDSDQSANFSTIYGMGVPNDISSLSPLNWYRFEGSGTTATDSGSGGNDGTLINGVTRSTDVPT